MDESRVLIGHGVDGLDPRDEIVEAAGAEDHGERGLLLIRGVDRDEPFRESVLSAAEVAAGDAQRLPVDAELVLDEPQLAVRYWVAAVCALRCGVELLQANEY